MRRIGFFALVGLVLLAIMGSQAYSSNTKEKVKEKLNIRNSIKTTLTGKHEVPPTTSNATGTADFRINKDSTTINYTLHVSNLADITGAHVHYGMADSTGPVVVNLFTGPAKTGPFTGNLAKGAITAADLGGPLQGKTIADFLAAAKAGNLYVNVHTTANPNGEIRGQLK